MNIWCKTGDKGDELSVGFGTHLLALAGRAIGRMTTRVTAVRIIAVDLTELLGLFAPKAEEGETGGWRRWLVWWVARDKKKDGGQ